MRDYDDHDDNGDQSIRLYTPIFQRVIILAAVVIAVPIVMWTITTFVRSYVARPKVPALERLASTNTLARIPALSPVPPIPSPADQSAPQHAEDAAANKTPELRKGPPALASLPDVSPSPGATDSSPAGSVQAAPAPSPAIAAPAATATSDAATANPASASVAALPRAAQLPLSAPPQVPRSTDNMALASAPSSSDRAIAWPNPNTASPPDFAAPRLSSPPPPPPPVRSAAAEVVPPDEPLRGPVPLPRHRPSVFAMSTSGPAVSGPVPLPRARPADAPAEAANPVIEPIWSRPDSDRF